MRSYIVSALLCASLAIATTSCGPKCKTCRAQVMGVTGPAQEVCGDELKRIEGTTGVTCE